MIIFILNCGSSSIKFQVIDNNSNMVLGKGQIERIGELKTTLIYNNSKGDLYKKEEAVITYREGINEIIKILTDHNIGCIGSVDDIDAVGHRVVHGGEKCFLTDFLALVKA